MTFDQLKPNKTLRGPLFAEPVQVIVTVPMVAPALSVLYPSSTDEKRWVDGVLARKKSLGF